MRNTRRQRLINVHHQPTFANIQVLALSVARANARGDVRRFEQHSPTMFAKCSLNQFIVGHAHNSCGAVEFVIQALAIAKFKNQFNLKASADAS